MLDDIGPFKSGDKVRASWLQRMLLAIRKAVNLRAGPGIKLMNTELGTIISLMDSTTATTTSPATLGSSTEGSETASTATWARNGTTSGTSYAGVPLNLWVICRVVYNEAGDKVLYSYAREMLFDSAGALYTVSAETRITVDTPGTCP